MSGTHGALDAGSLQAHLATIIRCSHDAILSTDLDGVVVSWNEAASALLGYEPDEALGHPISALLGPAIEDVTALVERLSRGDPVRYPRARAHTRGGAPLTLSLTVSPVSDQTGELIGLSVVGRDAGEIHAAPPSRNGGQRVHRRVQQISGRVVPSGEVETLYRELIEAAIEITGADRGTMQSLDAETGELVLVDAVGLPAELRDEFLRVRPDAGTSCAAALRRGVRAIVDYANDAEVAGKADARAHLQAGIRGAQSTPLIARSGRLVGMLSTHWAEPTELTPGQADLLDILARQAADLIERRAVNAALRESQTRERLRREQLETLLDQAPMGIYFVDADFRLQKVNPAGSAAFAGVPGGGLGQDFEEVLRMIWGERADDLVGIFRRTLATGEACHDPEFVGQRNDRGVAEYYDWRVERITQPEGDYGAVCYFRDISEQVHARRAISESEARYRALFDSMGQGFCILEMIPADDDCPLDFRYLDTNPAFARHTGIMDTRGRTVREVAAGGEPFWLEVCGEVVRKGGSLRLVGYDPPSGRWLDVEAFRTGSDGDHRVAVLFTDVTGRREADRERTALSAEIDRQRRLYDAILSGTPDLVYVFDLDYRFRYANQALLDMWGTTFEAAMGKGLRELGYEEWHAEMHEREIDQVVETHRPVRGEVSFPHASLGRRIYDYILVPVLDAAGRVEAVAGTTRDVTERKRTERELEEASRRKDEFIATLSHELRNPLAAIRTGIAVLQSDQDLSDRGARMASVIDRQSAQLVRLVDDLLEVSRISRGVVKLERRRTELGSLLRAAAADMAAAIEEEGLELRLHTGEDPVMVEVDPVRIEQVLQNLLHNARKFTPRGSAIEVAVEEEGGSAIIRVSDSGIGMGEDDLRRVFDMFARMAAPQNDTPQGLGIGLALVRSIVELHGGTVDATSEGTGKGSEFTVRLPLASGTTTAQEPELPAPSSEEDARPPRLRILAVEDQEDVLETLSLALRMRGHEVEEAVNGREAVKKVRRSRPDVVLLDIGMPEMDGHEVAREIRGEAWGRDILLIAMTGWGREEDKRAASEAGFDAHLTKPVEIEALERMLTSGDTG